MVLETATFDDIFNDYGLYREMLKLLETVDGKQPTGACCGKHKDQHIKLFLDNREKYITKMHEIIDRKIKPKFKGVIYVSKAFEHVNADTITDSKSLWLISKGFLPKDYFDWTDYYKDLAEQERAEEIRQQEIKQMRREIVAKAREARANKKLANSNGRTL